MDQMLSDYLLTHWPPGISIRDGSAARAVDDINDELCDWRELLERRRHFTEAQGVWGL